jgi:hypothetical protein
MHKWARIQQSGGKIAARVSSLAGLLAGVAAQGEAWRFEALTFSFLMSATLIPAIRMRAGTRASAYSRC